MAAAPPAHAQFSLDGKVAVVTGCSRGIGFAIAHALACAGADIVGISAGLETSGSAIQRTVEGVGRSFTAYQVDLSSRDDVRRHAATLVDNHPEIHILINNAGTISRLPAIESVEAEWDRVLEVNLSSQFLLAQSVARQMITRQSGGKIVFTASLLSFQGGVNVASYTASKSAVAGLTRALSNEWAVHGINVNAIAPGYIATANTQALQDDALRSRSIVERIPAGRWGRPDDIAGAAVFLASAASDYVNGVVLPVDGGWLGR